MMRKFSLALSLAFLVSLIACNGGTPAPSSSTAAAPAKKEAPAAPVAYTGREAFQKMHSAARLWAPDARPYRLESSTYKEFTGKDGRAVIWRAGFASAARRSLKAFLLSGAHSDDAPSYGVSSGVEDSYSPSNSSTQVFDSGFLKIDSDKALETAQKHGGEKLFKQNAQQPVLYLLSWSPRENILSWHVIYGASPSDAKLRIAVNASTGAFERVEK
jgi:hypothetical protein